MYAKAQFALPFLTSCLGALVLNWLFKRQEQAPSAPEPIPESLDLRMQRLESAITELRFDWESVISKINAKVARDAARSRREAERTLDAGDDAGGQEFVGQEASSAQFAPGSAEARAHAKQQLRLQARSLRQGRQA